MSAEQHGIQLLPVITLLAAAVITAPLSKRLGFGTVLGYLIGGIAIGPFGLRVFAEAGDILQVAELGVVLFLFLIGLEMQPARLWGMRRQIFGLGLAQVLACTLLLTGVGVVTGFPLVLSFVAGAGFVLTSTAIVMQLLEERGEMTTPPGQQMVSVLLLEDLMIVPLLALVTFLGPIGDHHPASGGIDWRHIGIALACIAALIVAGRYLLNPLFGMLASSRAREVMTAAALLVVLGAAYLMELGGLSMAMGAFAAGVLLSGSSYRHQLEVDIEPFRGVLLGLFFLAVGMSLDLAVVAANWRSILFYVVAYMLAKALAIYVIARLLRSPRRQAVDRAVYMAQGGEFAFVLYAAAAGVGIINAEQNAILTAIIILSMAATPAILLVVKAIRRRQAGAQADDPRKPDGLTGAALVIGFGRVGQIATQFLMARGFGISIIDTDVEMIDVARDLGFEVYYGDGTRLDILRAAGVEQARVVLVCVDEAEDGTQITALLKAEFPELPVVARAVDRVHSLALIRAGADVQVRETFESAVVMGEAALDRLGVAASEIADINLLVRKRDEKRLGLQLASGITAGRSLFFTGNADSADRP
ncbi:monovalent cation:proton antiporter-2 (CPA2) family protein [Stenotrophomonas lacuserhaii]|uniref:monovalent cation:proton antiporter-2 (CPA2) family protein n=1 Tax=Stenotrophomonas lacuserhaii TaxID=2760084 RepID=UPI0032EFADB5